MKDKSKNKIVKIILNKLLCDMLFEHPSLLKEYLEINFKKYFSFDINVSDIEKTNGDYSGSVLFKDDYNENVNIAFNISPHPF